MAKVGLVFGGRSVEHLVSVRSARAIAKGLTTAGHTIAALGISEQGRFGSQAASERALAGDAPVVDDDASGSVRDSVTRLLEADIDVIFPIVHGTYGEDGALQGLCEMLDLAYVGASVTTSAICMDKVATKRMLRGAGIPVVDDWVVTRAAFDADAQAAVAALPDAPLFVKPSVGGSSVGCTAVRDPSAAQAAIAHALRFDDVALVERAIAGLELECAVLGAGPLEASEVGEIVPGAEFYDYDDKYVTDAAQLRAPAPLSPDVRRRVRGLAVDAFASLGGTGLARVDFFLDDTGALFVNEINTLPGFTEISMYPRLWALSGLPLDRLVDRLVEIALAVKEGRARLDAARAEFVQRAAQKARGGDG